MKKPRISVRTFLALCLLVGAVAAPRGWKAYQDWKEERRQAEIESLETQLAEFWLSTPLVSLPYPPPLSESDKRGEETEKRLAVLTGKQPDTANIVSRYIAKQSREGASK